MLYNISFDAYNIGREGDVDVLGDNIKKYRKEKGYTQEELSALLHVVRQTLSKWENNVSVPDAEVLIRISKALDVTVSVLLDVPQEKPTVDLAGALAPRLPYQRHTGLRLPWTVSDEDTWNLAHKIIGFISLPITLLYLGAALLCEDTNRIGTISVAAMVLYIGVPGIVSLIFFQKKYHS